MKICNSPKPAQSQSPAGLKCSSTGYVDSKTLLDNSCQYTSGKCSPRCNTPAGSFVSPHSLDGGCGLVQILLRILTMVFYQSPNALQPRRPQSTPSPCNSFPHAGVLLKGEIWNADTAAINARGKEPPKTIISKGLGAFEYLYCSPRGMHPYEATLWTVIVGRNT